jgi:hypothetical protein
MSERTVIDVSQVVEQQKLGGFLVGLVVISSPHRTCRLSIISTGS